MDLLFLEKSLIGVFLAIVVATVISKLRGKKFRLPPGPIPVPVFGNWLQVGDDLNHRNLSDYAKKFGEIFMLRMGQRNLVVVSSPESAKEVLHTQGVEFGSRTRYVRSFCWVLAVCFWNILFIIFSKICYILTVENTFFRKRQFAQEFTGHILILLDSKINVPV